MVACLLFCEAEIVELHITLDEFLEHFARYRESELQWETGAFLEYLSDQQGGSVRASLDSKL
jgi:hypothetical protein